MTEHNNRVGSSDGTSPMNYGLPLFLDAAESLGSTLDGRSSAAYGTAVAVTFIGNKNMTTSGGGALFTDEEAFTNSIRFFPALARQPLVHFDHTDVGATTGCQISSLRSVPPSSTDWTG